MSDDPDCCIAELRHSLLQVLSSFPLKAFSSLYWPLEGTKYLRANSCPLQTPKAYFKGSSSIPETDGLYL